MKPHPFFDKIDIPVTLPEIQCFKIISRGFRHCLSAVKRTLPVHPYTVIFHHADLPADQVDQRASPEKFASPHGSTPVRSLHQLQIEALQPGFHLGGICHDCRTGDPFVFGQRLK